MKKKKVLVDMTISILHHGHIRLLKKASKYGNVIVGLTTDKDLIKYKKIRALKFKYRKEILKSIKYVKDVIPCGWKVTNSFLRKNKIDIIVRGDDYKNENFIIKKIIYKRTKNISSSFIRKTMNI
jgi:glycerol-3-phosphate cytidylyltransferase